MIQKITFIVLIIGSFVCAQNPIHLTVKDGLPSNHVYDVLEDDDGFIWFATNRGVSRYNGETFKNYTIKDGLQNNDIWLLEKDHKNRIWFISKSKYQSYFENDSIHKVKTSDDRVISPIVESSEDGLYFFSESTYKFNGKKINKIYDYQNILNRTQKLYNEGYNVYYNPENVSFLAFNDKKIVKFDSNIRVIKKVELVLKPTEYQIKRIIFISSNYCVVRLNSNLILINTETLDHRVVNTELDSIDGMVKEINNIIQITTANHLLLYDSDFSLIEKIKLPQNIRFNRAIKDSNGNFWAVSPGNGVSLIRNTQINGSYYLKNESVKRLGIIDSNIYAGVDGQGVFQIKDNLSKRLKDINVKDGKIYQIKNDYIISPWRSYRFIENKFNEIDATYYDNRIYTMFKDAIRFKEDEYYVSGFDLGKRNRQTYRADIIERKAGLIELETFNNKLYVGGSDGLNVLENDSIVKPNIKHDILQASINYIQKEDNYLYVATDGQGVYLYNEEEVIPLKSTADLFVQKVIKQNQDLWLATQKGVLKVTLNNDDLEASKITDRFVEADGLLQTNTNDIFIDGNILYAASDLGLAKLNVNNPIYKKQPNIYFNTKSDTLVYKDDARDNISISFAALDFKNQENITYKYKLEPTQTDWTVTNTKTLNFSNLSPNLYELQVLARDQHFNTTLVKQYLRILPKWWQTIYAKIGFLLLGFAGFALTFFVLKKQIRKREYERAERDKRVAGLELQALRSQMNPHFVHNSLNAIQYFIQRNEVELSENYLSKFSKLIRLFFEYSREQFITLQQEIELLNLYLEIEKLRFEDKLTYEIFISDELEVDEQTIPSMLLQPIVENALNHGLFHKKEQGNIKVTFKYIDERTMKVSVLDDGIGINKAKEIFKTSTKNYNSNSTAVLSERLALLNKSNILNIDYSIQDCSEIDANTTGTLVTLIFEDIQA